METGSVSLVMLFGVFILFTSFLHWLASTEKIEPLTGRRWLHAGTGLLVAFTPWFIESAAFLFVIAFVFGLGTIAGKILRWPEWLNGNRKQSWGTLYFCLGVASALLLTWWPMPSRPWVFQAAILVMALADPAASWVGTRYSGSEGKKTLAGSAAFFVVAMAAITLSLLMAPSSFTPSASFVGILSIAVSLAVAATIVESIGKRGIDNLTVVLTVCYGLLLYVANPEWVQRLPGAWLVGGGLFSIAVGLRWLTGRAAALGGLLAGAVIAIGGWSWFWPALVFFASSSLWSKVAARSKPEHGEPRTVSEAVAKAAVGTAILLGFGLTEQWWLYPAFVGALAGANADTWGTELGSMSRSRPRILGIGPSVNAGTPGAMSPLGIVASVLGAAAVAFAALASESVASRAWILMGVAFVIAGLAGALADTFVGALGRHRLAPRPRHIIANLAATSVGALVGLLLIGAM